jgi:hypothetical protein
MTAPVSSSAGWRSPASGPGRRRDATPAADRGCRGWAGVRVAGKPQLPASGATSKASRGVPWSGQCWRCSITGSSSGSSSSRLVKPATKRRRRQCRAVSSRSVQPATRRSQRQGRAVPGGDRRQAGQGDGEAAHRLPIGRAVAWSVLAVLDHRQFGRFFVLSIGEAGHGATTAPGSSSAGWRSPASGARSKARQRTGCRSGGPWPGQDLGVLDHRQFGRFFVLSIGEAGHGATTAPVSSSAGWRSPASGARSKARQHTGSRSGVPWPGQCWRDSITGSSSGSSSSRLVKPATRRRRRQCRTVPGGDRRQAGQVEGETARRLPIGRAVAWSGSRSARSTTKRRRRQCRAVPGGDRRQVVPGRRRGSAPAADRAGRGLVRISGCSINHEATTAPVSSSAGWRSPASGARATARQRTGCRSGGPWPGQDLGVLDQPRSDDGASVEQCRVAIAGKRCQVEGEAAHRQPIGRAVAWSWCRVAGKPRLPWSDPCWRDSITGSSSGSSSSRSVQPATKRRRRQGRAVPGGNRRQSVPGRRRGSAPAADRAGRGLVRISGCSITGSSAGSSSSRSVQPATRR